MKSLNNHLLAWITGLGLGLFSQVGVHAETVPAPASGDIFIGFRASGGDGASNSYLIKVGTYSQLSAVAAGTTTTLSSLGDVGADLAAVYGADWHSRPDLFWGVFGIGSSASAVVYASRERVSDAVASVTWPTLTDTTRASTFSQVNSVINSIGGYRSSVATANSPYATLQVNFSGAASYQYQVASPGTSDFGSVSQWTGIEGDFGSGVSGTALDLYRFTPSGVSRLGYFKITSSGQIRYTSPSAVTDSDLDGLVDTWEQQYFGNLTSQNGTSDADGDGQSNLDEQVFGTNPASAADAFRLANFARSAGSVAFTFQSIPSRTYQVYYSTDLSASSWQLIDTVSGGATPSSVNYQDTNPARIANSKGFYRIAVVAP